MRNRIGELDGLPFIQDTPEERDFWQVSPSGDYRDDYRTGAQYAQLTLGRPHLLADVLYTIAAKNDTSGLAIGFIRTIAEHIAASR